MCDDWKNSAQANFCILQTRVLHDPHNSGARYIGRSHVAV